MRPPLSFAIVGCGRLAEVGYAPAMSQVAGASLRAVVDPDRGRRERLARRAGGAVRSFGSIPELLDEARPDVAVVASPPEFHLEHAECAARAGACVLVEKPAGRSAEETARLARLDPPVWVGFNRRFSHLSSLAGRVPRDGGLDLSMRISYRRASWRAHEVRDDALTDLGPHLADLAVSLLGRVSAARARAVAPERARLDLIGPRGTARLVCETDAPWSERIEIRRADGTLAGRSVHGGVARGLAGRLRRREHPLVASLARQLRALVLVERGGRDDLLATASDAALAMRALEATRRSAAAGGEVVAL